MINERQFKLKSALQGIGELLTPRFDYAENAQCVLGYIKSEGQILEVQLTLEKNRKKWLERPDLVPEDVDET